MKLRNDRTSPSNDSIIRKRQHISPTERETKQENITLHSLLVQNQNTESPVACSGFGFPMKASVKADSDTKEDTNRRNACKAEQISWRPNLTLELIKLSPNCHPKHKTDRSKKNSCMLY